MISYLNWDAVPQYSTPPPTHTHFLPTIGIWPWLQPRVGLPAGLTRCVWRRWQRLGRWEGPCVVWPGTDPTNSEWKTPLDPSTSTGQVREDAVCFFLTFNCVILYLQTVPQDTFPLHIVRSSELSNQGTKDSPLDNYRTHTFTHIAKNKLLSTYSYTFQCTYNYGLFSESMSIFQQR